MGFVFCIPSRDFVSFVVMIFKPIPAGGKFDGH